MGSFFAGDLLSPTPPPGVNTGDVLTWGATGWEMARPSGGAGGSDGDVLVEKSAPQAIVTAGFVDVLTFPVTPLKDYEFECFVIYQSSATTMGCLFALNGPASPTLFVAESRKQVTVGGTASASMFSEAILSAYNVPLPNSVAEPAANANLLCTMRGVIRCGALGGTLALRASKENVAGTLTIQAGSFVKYRLMN